MLRLSNLRTLGLCLTAMGALSLPTFAQGPVVLMGIDAEDGNGAGGGGHGGHTPYTDVIQNGILPNATNGGSGILVIGGGKSPTDNVTEFWNAMGANTGEAVTHVNGAANIAAQSFAGFKMIGIASSSSETPSGGLLDSENNALSGRAADIATHVNGGGGLLCTSQSGLTTPYGYLGSVGAFTFDFPAQFSAVTATPEGEALGITDTNMDVCCWHDEYLTFPGFLDVLATNDATGNPCALGGFNVVIVQGIVLTPLHEINVVGTDHTVTATVADDMGNPVVGVEVNFEITSGPHAGTTDSDITNGAGQAFFTWTGNATGLDTIVGCFIDNNNEEQCDTVTKEWVAECFLVVGDGPGISQFTPTWHTLTTQLNEVQEYYPVLTNDLYEIMIDPPGSSVYGGGGSGGVFGNIGVARSAYRTFAVEVLMYNEEVFPNQPEHNSNGLLVYIDGYGNVATIPYGSGTMSTWAQVGTNSAGKRYVRFPFTMPQ